MRVHHVATGRLMPVTGVLTSLLGFQTRHPLLMLISGMVSLSLALVSQVPAGSSTQLQPTSLLDQLPPTQQCWPSSSSTVSWISLGCLWWETEGFWWKCQPSQLLHVLTTGQSVPSHLPVTVWFAQAYATLSSLSCLVAWVPHRWSCSSETFSSGAENPCYKWLLSIADSAVRSSGKLIWACVTPHLLSSNDRTRVGTSLVAILLHWGHLIFTGSGPGKSLAICALHVPGQIRASELTLHHSIRTVLTFYLQYWVFLFNI